MTAEATADPVPRIGTYAWTCLLGAWLIAVCATFGALFIGEVLGREPCSLCWYQRAFMFPLAVILGVATYISDARVWRYGLPLVAIGGAIAAYHSLLYAGLIPEPIRPCVERLPCSGPDMMIFGLPLPYLALGSFAAIGALLAASRQGGSQ